MLKTVLNSALGWLGANWLPVLIGSAVLVGYLWITNLQRSRDEALQDIQRLEIQIQEVAAEAKRQADAFEFLQAQFLDYQVTVEA